MYSFAQREDTRVVDEPLYGHYLRVSAAGHPGRDAVMAAMNCDGDAVMQDLLRESETDPRTLFLKQMAHHLVGLDLDFMHRTRNVFLVRDPEQMLPSLVRQLPHAGLADTGLDRQWQTYEWLVSSGQQPAIVDSRELLLHPESVLRQLCSHLGMTFTDAMLSWEPGAREEDGVWAPHWYHAVHQSSGFEPYREKTNFPDRLRPLLAECRPWYDKLYAKAIRANDGE
jgi:hypothetical protein